MFRLISLASLFAALAALGAPPALHLTGVTAFAELSDQSNQTGTHVFVVTFDRAVRNRGGFLVVKNGESTLRLPVHSTVGEVAGRQPGYDEATPQLEIREWETHFLDGFGDDSAGREATLRAAIGQAVSLELEPCPAEFTLGVQMVKDSHYLDPELQRPGHPFPLLVLATNGAIVRNNGAVRTTVKEKGELKYLWFFLYPRGLEAPADEVHLATHLIGLDLKDAALAQALVGRTLGVEVSDQRPWLPLPSPFPGGASGCFQNGKHSVDTNP